MTTVTGAAADAHEHDGQPPRAVPAQGWQPNGGGTLGHRSAHGATAGTPWSESDVRSLAPVRTPAEAPDEQGEVGNRSELSCWLIDVTTGAAARRTGQHSDLAASDDRNRISTGNLVEPLIDGAAYIDRWTSEARVLLDEPEEASLCHFAWKLHDVGAKGWLSAQDRRVFSLLEQLKVSGVQVTLLLSGHGFGIVNRPTLWKLRRRGIEGVILDELFAQRSASQHGKFTTFRRGKRARAMIGSADLARNRWDTTAHDPLNPARYRISKPPSHDVGLVVEGPAVRHIEDAASRFLDTLRTEGLTHNRRRIAIPGPQRRSMTGDPQSAVGDTVIQVLATVPPQPASDVDPEFSIYHAYVNAIMRATDYIYIEDQFFWPALAYSSSRFCELQMPDLLPMLIEKLKEGVDVIVVVPPPGHGVVTRRQADARHFALAALRRAQGRGRGAHGLSGSFTAAVACRHDRCTRIHSKLLLCDDAYFIVGSQNVNRRSMFGDFELAVGVVDHALARCLRQSLWSEHLETSPDDLADCRTAAGILRRRVQGRTGRLVPYPDVPPPDEPGIVDRLFWDYIIDSHYR